MQKHAQERGVPKYPRCLADVLFASGANGGSAAPRDDGKIRVWLPGAFAEIADPPAHRTRSAPERVRQALLN